MRGELFGGLLPSCVERAVWEELRGGELWGGGLWPLCVGEAVWGSYVGGTVCGGTVCHGINAIWP